MDGYRRNKGMYKDRYQEYLQLVPDKIRVCEETKRRPVLAYASNLDVLVRWDCDRFNRLLEVYLKGEPSFKEGEEIRNGEDLARILSYFAIHGLGGEVDITSQSAVDVLTEYFDVEYGLGGTCAQGAAALGSIGVPVLVHITDCSRNVLDQMSGRPIEAVKEGRVVPVEECVSQEEALQHFIVQYSKDDVIRAAGKEYKVKLSNRLIMGYDKIHKVLPVKEDFLSYCEKNAGSLCSYDISGFNAVIEKDIMKERLERLVAHYKAVKVENPDCRIYFESAHFINNEIREYTYQTLSGVVDLMGMNEEELEDLTRTRGHAIDKGSLMSVLGGLEELAEVYPVHGFVVHSKDYALYFGKDMPGIDIEQGLTMGNLLSGTRARTGRYGSLCDCEETLGLALSSAGLAFAKELENYHSEYKTVLVPSRYLEMPKTTIGLGDSFVAGMQMCFIPANASAMKPAADEDKKNIKRRKG